MRLAAAAEEGDDAPEVERASAVAVAAVAAAAVAVGGRRLDGRASTPAVAI